MNEDIVPIVLFTYARPDHLNRTLKCLRDNNVPLIYAYSDGPKTQEVEPKVDEVRSILNNIDWCEIQVIPRKENLGLGKSIMLGVTETFKKHEAIIVFEDDLECVVGTYQYMCAALDHYKTNNKVMSITGWTHPVVTPSQINDQPYFDGRSESWSWGSWARAWEGMNQSAETKMTLCKNKGLDIYKYGADLPEIAQQEGIRNVWAVRFNLHHILNEGLCLRPPYSLVNHFGFDSSSTNAKESSNLIHSSLDQCPNIPKEWPEPIENPECSKLWRIQCGDKLTYPQRIRKTISKIVPNFLHPSSIKSFFIKISK